MLGLFSSKTPATGLDLSDISLKIMQFAPSGKNVKVLGFTDHSLPKGIVVNDVVMDEVQLVSKIQEAFKKPSFGKIDGRKVIVSIPEAKAFVRVIQIPKMTEEQAAAAVPIEAEQYIPVPLDQTYLDWEIIAEHDEKLEVLVTASPREFIDNYLRILKNAGLEPIAFEVESAACVRALISNSAKDKSVLIMDMDTYRTSLIVSDGGHLQFTSSVPIAGDAFTQAIARALGVEADEAERIKRGVGLDDSKENINVKNALMPVADNLLNEVKNMIKFHDDHASANASGVSGNPISQIILCGGTSKLLHLSSYMYQRLTEYPQVDIILGNPWVNLFDPRLHIPPPLGREESLSYTTAIGLASRSLI